MIDKSDINRDWKQIHYLIKCSKYQLDVHFCQYLCEVKTRKFVYKNDAWCFKASSYTLAWKIYYSHILASLEKPATKTPLQSFGLELGLWTSRILFAKSSTSLKEKPQTQLKMGPPKPRSKRAAMDMDDGYSPMGQKKSKVGFKVNKVQNGYIISKRPFFGSLFL